MNKIRAADIYDRAVKRAAKDHRNMIRQFVRREIEIASPCGIERERQYIIQDFEKALSAVVGKER